jgi:hypothetical protein
MEENLERDKSRDRMHVHFYQTEADVAGKNRHQHLIIGISNPAEKEGMSHVHCLRGYTSYFMEEKCEHGHWHWVDVTTDIAKELCDDGHIHFFYGTTSVNDGHCHRFKGSTGLGAMECWCEKEEYAECGHHECEEEKCEMPMHYKMKKYGEMEEECCEEMPMHYKKKKHEMEECCEEMPMPYKKKHEMEECCEEMPMPYKKKKHEMEECCEEMPMHYKKKKKRDE